MPAGPVVMPGAALSRYKRLPYGGDYLSYGLQPAAKWFEYNFEPPTFGPPTTPAYGGIVAPPPFQAIQDQFGGNAPGSTQAGVATDPGTVSVGPHGNPGMASGPGIGLSVASSMMGPAGIAVTAGQALNAMQAMGLLSPATLSPNAIAIANDPDAIAALDPDGTIAIAPAVNSIMHDVVVAQQNGMGIGGTGVAGVSASSPGSGGSTGVDDPSDGAAGWKRGGLARAARSVAKAGRYGDTRLMHVAPEEIGALSRIGRITKNPKTGLPEAFSLKKAFKAIAPIAGSVLGNYLGGSLGSAAGGALGSIASGGDVKDAALSGALSYGLGKLGQLESLGGTGLTSLSDDWDRLTSGALGGGGTALDRLWGPDAPDAPLTKPQAEGAISHVAGQGGGSLVAGGAFDGKTSDLMKYAPLGLLALSAMSPQQQQQAVEAASQPTGNTGIAAEGLGTPFPTGRKRRLRGLADFDSILGGIDPTQAFYEYEEETEPTSYRRGGLTGYARGRMVRGPGDGVQDAIPARLSRGEYVIPAHAVSAIGNGSTDAGGERLDRMVSGVMRQKFGSPNRIPPRVRMPGLSAAR